MEVLKKNTLTGNYNDISINTVNDFCKEARKIIESKPINTVILSVGPFRYSEILVQLKKEFPNIKFVIDYRDRREDGYAGLTETQKMFENNQQIEVLKQVDLIITVNDHISEEISKINKSKKVYTMPHCVDTDFLRLNIHTENKNAEGKFIYGGELYNGLENEVELFVKFKQVFETIQTQKSGAEFYLTYPAYPEIFEKDTSVKTSPFLNKKLYQQKLIEADYVLIFRPSWSAEALSSKFFELLCLRKPILYFGKKGKVSEFLLTNKLGFHITSENCNEMAHLLIANNKSKEIPDLNYDISKHSFEFHTKLLVGQIENLINSN
jgi:glycosyltransferase involved in cell wall biosynthesis